MYKKYELLHAYHLRESLVIMLSGCQVNQDVITITVNMSHLTLLYKSLFILY